jgi:hypothetical protein
MRSALGASMEGVRSALVNLRPKRTNIGGGERPWPMSESVRECDVSNNPSHFSSQVLQYDRWTRMDIRFLLMAGERTILTDGL